MQYKDNPKELIWEFKRLMMDNEIKSQEIGFLKTMLQDLKSPDPKKSKSWLSISTPYLLVEENEEQIIDI